MFGFYFIVFLVAVAGLIFILRAFGAWMLRIDEVIDLNKQLNRQVTELVEIVKNLQSEKP